MAESIPDATGFSDAEPEGPEIDWDGESPIDGEPVTERIAFAGREYAFTARCVYRARAKAVLSDGGQC